MQIFGGSEVAARLGSIADRFSEAAKGSLNGWAQELASYIIAEKLSGQVLKRRSGRLSRSVHGYTDAQADSVSGGAAAGRNVPYARIHEFGGMIPAHTVVARNARALMIPLKDGRTIFRRSANIPEVEMPVRSYMRSGLADRRESGLALLREALKQALA